MILKLSKLLLILSFVVSAPVHAQEELECKAAPITPFAALLKPINTIIDLRSCIQTNDFDEKDPSKGTLENEQKMCACLRDTAKRLVPMSEVLSTGVDNSGKKDVATLLDNYSKR